MVIKEMNINGRKIGPQEPPYIIAEMSANHNGDIKMHMELLIWRLLVELMQLSCKPTVLIH